MANDVIKTPGGLSFVGLLTIVFVIAKITGYITWSWWWVFSPIWISFIFSLILMIVILSAAYIINQKERKK